MQALSPTIEAHLRLSIAQLSPRTIVELSTAPRFHDSTKATYRHQDIAILLAETQQSSFEMESTDLAIVVNAPCHGRKVRVEQLLSYLRHTGTRSILAINTADTERHLEPWRDQDFLALGFRRTEGSRQAAPDYQIYYYDIRNYKLTPSWLNARHWANPNRWDAERW